MTKKSDAPAIRFKGFSDAWEQRKAIDIADYSKGNGYSKGDLTDAGTPIILYGRLYTKYQFAISEVDTFAFPRNGAVYSQGNEVIVPASGETAEDIARASAVEKSGVLLGGDLNILRPFDFINPLFLALAISNGEPQKELAKKAQGKSVVHIHNTDIQEVTIAYPSRTEQDRIVSVFRQLDNLITLHQRKFEKLTNVKKSMLEKMFPQNGSSYPEIRFKGFTDPWEQRKLGDIADIVGGGTPSTGNQSYWDGDIDWYAPAEIADQIYANSSQKKITGLGYENSSAKMLPPGTVLFTSRAGIGKTAILTRKGCTNQGFQSIVPHRGELDSYFIFSRTEELKRYGELVGAGSTFVEVSGKQMAVMELMMPPTMREQQTIGGFFQQLDHLITLHQRKCALLFSPFQAFISMMFITSTFSWEQRKFEEIAVRSSVICSDDTLPRVEYEDIVSGTGRLNKDIYAKQSSKSGIAFHQGDVLYGKLRPYLQNWLLPTFDGLAVGDFWVLQPQNADSSFLYRLIQSRQFDEVANQSTGTKMPRADWKLVSKTVFSIPSSISEQAAIGTYFTALDSLITLHQRELEKLQNIKKSMLEKMFV